VVERIRQVLTAQPIEIGCKQVLITISSGIADLEGKHESLDTFLGRVDQALYQAKEAGRNCVIVSKSR
jgi:diguanylate cyclase (GGDEF)-like protein